MSTSPLDILSQVADESTLSDLVRRARVRVPGIACVSEDQIDHAAEEDDEDDATHRVNEESPCTSTHTIVSTTLTNRAALTPMHHSPQSVHGRSASASAAAATHGSSAPVMEFGVSCSSSRAAADHDYMSESMPWLKTSPRLTQSAWRARVLRKLNMRGWGLCFRCRLSYLFSVLPLQRPFPCVARLLLKLRGHCFTCSFIHRFFRTPWSCYQLLPVYCWHDCLAPCLTKAVGNVYWYCLIWTKFSGSWYWRKSVKVSSQSILLILPSLLLILTWS